MDQVLLYFAIKYNGDWDKIYSALDSKEKISREKLENIENGLCCKYITILNPTYPNYLKNSHKPPFVLFYQGDISLLTDYHKTIALVGGQKYSDYNKIEIEKFVKSLSFENRIISTFHEVGTNEEILDQAIKYKSKIILVVKNSLDKFLNESKQKIVKLNSTQNLIISESLNGDIDLEISDEHSNRILVGVSKAIVFTNFDSREEVSDLTEIAINENKDIFAIPENNRKYSGPNKLIKQGAKLVENASDILNEL